MAAPKPRAKPGLLACDHSKRGRRFVTMLDEGLKRVTLLAPWEHAVLVLCDGSRTIPEIAELLEGGIDDEPVTSADVARCVAFFEREGLLDSVQGPIPELGPPGPKTMANLQQAYREWHKDPEVSGRILSGLLSPPFMDHPPPYRPSLGPTVALPEEDDRQNPVSVGSTLIVDGPPGDGRALRSVLDTAEPNDAEASPSSDSPAFDVREEDLTNVAELLAAVDFDLAEDGPLDNGAHRSLPPVEPNGERTHRDRAPPDPVVRAAAQRAQTIGRAVGGIAELPSTASKGAGRDALARGDTAAGALVPERFRHRKLSEAALTPTLVGQAPPDGDGPPVLVAPPRSGSSPSPKSAGHRVMATIGPEPSAPDIDGEDGGTLEDKRPPPSKPPASAPPAEKSAD